MKSWSVCRLSAFVVSVFLIFFGSSVFGGVPDLTVESIQVNPATPTSGGPATLVVVVKNVGAGPHKSTPLFFSGAEAVLKAFAVPLYNGAEHGLAIPPLNAGQSKVFTFNKTASLSPGSYTIQAGIWPTKPWAVPPSGPNQESNLSNNTKDFSFTVSAGAATKPGSKKNLHKIPEAEAPTAPPKKPLD